MTVNKQIILDSRPEGAASTKNFVLREQAIPDLRDGQVLVRHLFLSLDPYMRGRMNAGKSYAQAQALGEVMIGGTVGVVEASNHARFKVGDTVVVWAAGRPTAWSMPMRPVCCARSARRIYPPVLTWVLWVCQA